MQVFTLKKYGAPKEAFVLEEKKSIKLTDDFSVRVEVEAFGINFADVMARQGLYKDAPPTPCVIGYEVVGKIKEVGAKVSKVKVGTRVMCFTRFGGYASEIVAHESQAIAIPETMEAGVACALTTQYCTAYVCAEVMTTVHAYDHVLVQAAAGGVGTALVQLLKRKKATIYGTAGSDTKIKYLEKLGVDHPINYTKENFFEMIKKKRGKSGLDIVFDSLGGKAFRDGFKLLGSGGRIIGIGIAESAQSRGQMLGLAKLMMQFGLYHPALLLMQSKSIIGVNMLRLADDRRYVLEASLNAVLDLYLKGEISPVVGGVYNYKELSQAHTDLEFRQTVGKLVVTW